MLADVSVAMAHFPGDILLMILLTILVLLGRLVMPPQQGLFRNAHPLTGRSSDHDWGLALES